MTNEIRPSRCTCGIKLWDKHPAQEVRPGHYIVCIYCGQIMLLNQEMRGMPIALSSVPEEMRSHLRAMQRTARIVGPLYRHDLEHRRKRTN